VGPVLGVSLAHLIFDLPMLQFSKHVHNGTGQWIAESIATFGLLATIWGCRAHPAEVTAFAVAAYSPGPIGSPHRRRSNGGASKVPAICARMKPNTSADRTPAKVSATARAMVTAGLANDVRRHECRGKEHSLRHLYPRLHRSTLGAGVQFPRRPAGGFRSLYQKTDPGRLGAGSSPLREVANKRASPTLIPGFAR
jgi:hypothetical protein